MIQATKRADRFVAFFNGGLYENTRKWRPS